MHASLARLLELGATEYQPVIERGHGFNTAAVVDPFGNILGIMENPHYLEIVERDRARRAAYPRGEAGSPTQAPDLTHPRRPHPCWRHPHPEEH